MDQIVDASLVGSEYILLKGQGNDDIEVALVISDQNDTQININGVFYQDLANAGDFSIITGDKFNADGNLYISTNNPDDKLFVYQGTGRVINQNFPSAN